MGSFAEFEHAMRERACNGLLAARKEGRIGGCRPKLTARQQAEIVHLANAGEKTAADAARPFNVHPCTVARRRARRADVQNTRLSAVTYDFFCFLR